MNLSENVKYKKSLLVRKYVKVVENLKFYWEIFKILKNLLENL